MPLIGASGGGGAAQVTAAVERASDDPLNMGAVNGPFTVNFVNAEANHKAITVANDAPAANVTLNLSNSQAEIGDMMEIVATVVAGTGQAEIRDANGVVLATYPADASEDQIWHGQFIHDGTDWMHFSTDAPGAEPQGWQLLSATPGASLAPGNYILDASAFGTDAVNPAFSVTIPAGTRGEWRFADPNMTLAVDRFVRVLRGSGAMTMTDDTGAQIADDLDIDYATADLLLVNDDGGNDIRIVNAQEGLATGPTVEVFSHIFAFGEADTDITAKVYWDNFSFGFAGSVTACSVGAATASGPEDIIIVIRNQTAATSVTATLTAGTTTSGDIAQTLAFAGTDQIEIEVTQIGTTTAGAGVTLRLSGTES